MCYKTGTCKRCKKIAYIVKAGLCGGCEYRISLTGFLKSPHKKQNGEYKKFLGKT